MKKNIHPAVTLIQFRCASCNKSWVCSSTKMDGKVEAGPGGEFPTVVLETCSNCHPFYTEKQTFIDTAGRVEKYNKRYGGFSQPKAAEVAEGEK